MSSRKVLVIGHATDRTIIHTIAEARIRGVPVFAVDFRELVYRGAWRLAVPDDGSSFLVVPGSRIAMSDVCGIFTRPVSLGTHETDQSLRARWHGAYTALITWLEASNVTVVNRPGGHRHNSSKPLHEALLKGAGLDVPPSITSSDPAELRDFATRHPAISKSCSGVRGEARLVEPSDFEKYTTRQGPVHLQKFIQGYDVRAHVVADQVFAVQIESDAIDYRAAPSERKHYSYQRLPDSLERSLVEITCRMGVQFAGWDLKVDDDGVYWCLEANFMPAYRHYDLYCSGDISSALLRLLYQSSRQEFSSPPDSYFGRRVRSLVHASPSVEIASQYGPAEPHMEELFIPKTHRYDTLRELMNTDGTTMEDRVVAEMRRLVGSRPT